MTFELEIVAEAGLPYKIAARARRWIVGELAEALGSAPAVSVRSGALSLDENGNVHLSDSLARTTDRQVAVVFVTERPRLRRGAPAPVQIDAGRSAAIVSVPACGSLRLQRAVSRFIVSAAADLQQQTSVNAPLRFAESRRRRWRTDDDDGSQHALISSHRWGWTRIVLGMARVNRPWRLLSTLKGVLAAAAATASFGIFYTSIWQMASALSVVRLIVVSALSVTAMSAWLIIANHLWERRTSGAYSKAWARLYNSSTMITVLTGVLTMYAALYAATLLGALVVIDMGFMSTKLGEQAAISNFLVLAWLATSMGSIAGALGSSADSYDAILRATFAKRERERRIAKDDQEARESGSENEPESGTADAGSDAPASGSEDAGTGSGTSDTDPNAPDASDAGSAT